MSYHTVYPFNRTVFYKFSQTCRLKHVDTICEVKNCEELCENRHPRACKFYMEYGRCKYLEYCRYRHDTTKVDVENRFEIIETKVNDIDVKIQKALENKTIEILELQSNISSMSIKIEEFEAQLAMKDTSLEHLQDNLKTIDILFKDSTASHKTENMASTASVSATRPFNTV